VDALVMVDNQPVSLRPDGTFSAETSFLKEGVGTIVIEVRDGRGKTTIVERNVQVQF
jgi:hypothetical protein